MYVELRFLVIALIWRETLAPGQYILREQVTGFTGVWMNPRTDLDAVENIVVPVCNRIPVT
jgi:hypothetical protein